MTVSAGVVAGRGEALPSMSRGSVGLGGFGTQAWRAQGVGTPAPPSPGAGQGQGQTGGGCLCEMRGPFGAREKAPGRGVWDASLSTAAAQGGRDCTVDGILVTLSETSSF